MLLLNNLKLLQFRNYEQKKLTFSSNIIGICGVNGSGKTNILDAIYYLSFCKSYFNRTDTSNATHGLKGFRIEANYLLKNDNVNTTCIVRENNKKEFYFDSDEYKKLSEHIGKLPCVIITPDDTEIITGTSELRRKFIDIILSQTQPNYLQHLIDYNNVLQQRNSLFKHFAKTQYLDNTLLEVIDKQLIEKGNFIFNCRNIFLKEFLVLVQKNYELISSNKEKITCTYDSQLLDNNFELLLKNCLQQDMYLQRSTTGIHKDDLEFLLNNIKFKTEASQGQRKSLLFALKLSEWQYLQQFKGFYPILLLDDVFEKLDENRMQNLLQLVTTNNTSQIFITDTHKERLEKHLQSIKIKFEIVEV